ncbi:uncharacterized protein LOC135202492 isoform X2 [Macrobrachium nipponense]|uniref:uncharacterized protein LOC135202492 isoform X2 n=1 Tax=Macrobrachium nipponense TaxID=159736 RepID=UPI0030C80325
MSTYSGLFTPTWPTRMSAFECWKEAEATHWEPISSLGPQWMVKSEASGRGYILMLTDGCGIWGEKRSARYIQEQADEWAPCIEAGVMELSRLVLSEMMKSAVASWENNREKVKLSINSKLNDLSYSWEFHVTRLDDELFKQHWTTPFLVHFHYLGATIKQLRNEVENKNRQLEELMPDNKKSKTSNKSQNKSKVAPIEVSAEAVLASGMSSVSEEQSILYPQIMACLHKIRNPENKHVAIQKGLKVATSRTKNKNQEEGNTEEFGEEELRKQEEREAKIQEILTGNPIPTTPQKKKKKLKI